MTTDFKTDVRNAAAAVNAYASGRLSPARHAIIAWQSKTSPDVKSDIAFQDYIAAHLMPESQDVPLSSDFFDRLETRLNGDGADDWRVEDIQTLSMPTLSKLERGEQDGEASPKSLSQDYLARLKWKTLVPGVSMSHVMGPEKAKDGERLFFLKVKGGMKMPVHSHNGEEWTLVLQGGYNVGETQYNCGDLHISNDNDEHAPHIHPGQDCICLVMTEGPLKMQGWLPRLLQPVIGI